MKELNKLIAIEISLKSLKSVVKASSPGITIWTGEAGVSGGEILIDLKDVKKRARDKIALLKKQKEQILRKIPKEKRLEVQAFLDKDKVIKRSYKIS